MNSNKHQEFHRRAAKKLLKLIRAQDVAALARVRTVYLDTKGRTDDEVIASTTLMRCQHVIAKEAGFDNWTELLKAPAPGPQPASGAEPPSDERRRPDTEPRARSLEEFIHPTNRDLIEREKIFENTAAFQLQRMAEQQDAILPRAMREMIESRKQIEDAIFPRAMRELIESQKTVEDAIMPRALRESLESQKNLRDALGFDSHSAIEAAVPDAVKLALGVQPQLDAATTALGFGMDPAAKAVSKASIDLRTLEIAMGVRPKPRRT